MYRVHVITCINMYFFARPCTGSIVYCSSSPTRYWVLLLTTQAITCNIICGIHIHVRIVHIHSMLYISTCIKLYFFTIIGKMKF